MGWKEKKGVTGVIGKSSLMLKQSKSSSAYLIFLCLSGFVLALGLFKCNLLYLSNKMVSETAVLQSQ